MPRKPEAAVDAAHVASQIHLLRGYRVLLDSDLAGLYVTEAGSLRSQFVTLKTGRGQHRKYAPLAFREHGAIMAATILNSARAVEMSVYVVRAFVKLREVLASNTELARKLDALEKSVSSLDAGVRRQFEEVYGAILSLMAPAMAEQ